MPPKYHYTPFKNVYNPCLSLPDFLILIEKIFLQIFPPIFLSSHTIYLSFLCFIECQGEQHYKPVAFFGGDAMFCEQMKRDAVKRDYAAAKGICLFEIPYTIRSRDMVYSYLDEMFEQIGYDL